MLTCGSLELPIPDFRLCLATAWYSERIAPHPEAFFQSSDLASYDLFAVSAKELVRLLVILLPCNVASDASLQLYYCKVAKGVTFSSKHVPDWLPDFRDLYRKEVSARPPIAN